MTFNILYSSNFNQYIFYLNNLRINIDNLKVTITLINKSNLNKESNNTFTYLISYIYLLYPKHVNKQFISYLSYISNNYYLYLIYSFYIYNVLSLIIYSSIEVKDKCYKELRLNPKRVYKIIKYSSLYIKVKAIIFYLKKNIKDSTILPPSKLLIYLIVFLGQTYYLNLIGMCLNNTKILYFSLNSTMYITKYTCLIK